MDIGQDSRHRGAWGFPNVKNLLWLSCTRVGLERVADRGPEVSGGDNATVSHPAQDPNATLTTSANID